MLYQPVHIAPELRPVIKSFWVLESEHGDAAGQQVFKTMADGCPGFIYQPADQGILYQADKKLAEAFIFGQTTRYAELELNGKFNAIGIIFQPNALRTVFNYDAEELTDSCVDVDELSTRPSSKLSEQLANAPDLGSKADMISSYLLTQIAKGKQQDDAAMQYTLQQIIASDGKIPLKNLQDHLQLSERSFQRNFKRYTGISPKLFARICRFQASLKQIQHTGMQRLTDVAFEHEYADQSHFIRSFKEFAGFSPNQYQKQTNIIADSISEII